MIAHANVIANILQVTTYESVPRKQNGVGTQVSLGLLPFSHIYALVVICHVGTYRGDEIIVLPKFDLKALLAAVQNFKIRQMCIVSSLPNQPDFLIDHFPNNLLTHLTPHRFPPSSSPSSETKNLPPNTTSPPYAFFTAAPPLSEAKPLTRSSRSSPTCASAKATA